MSDIVKQQYEWIRENRQVLFDFLENIPLHVLHESVPGFGHGSIIRTHIHALDSYRFWVGSFAAGQHPSEYRDTADKVICQADVQKVRNLFAAVDDTVRQFLKEYEGRWHDEIENAVEWSDRSMKAPALFLLTHTMTHECHHRGQLLAMARHLGYASADDRLGSLFS